MSAGQLDGMTDAVLGQWMASGNCNTLRSIDLDSSDNITEDMLGKAGHFSINNKLLHCPAWHGTKWEDHLLTVQLWKSLQRAGRRLNKSIAGFLLLKQSVRGLSVVF